MLVNTLASARRRRWNHEQPAPDPYEAAGTASPGIADATTQVDDADAMRRALDNLPTHQREVVVLRYYAHLTEQQIATVLATPAGTVKSRLSRALRLLADDTNLTEMRDPR